MNPETHKSLLFLFFLGWLLGGFLQQARSQASLVKDIYSGINTSFPGNFTNINGTLYFSARDSTNGFEFWKSDGTAAGTVIVKDIYPGVSSSSPSYFTNINDTLYFFADEGINGFELWKSDGTAAGTVIVKDINPGSGGSELMNLTNVNGTLYFVANDGTNGRELWKSDGTAAGTVMVKDINPGSNSSSPTEITNVNGIVYFSAFDFIHGIELWKSDGTAAGTVLVKDIWPGNNTSNLKEFTNVNGTLYFQAWDNISGIELWKSDGTAAGTVMVKDIYPGSFSSIPSYLTNVNGTLYFNAWDGVIGQELWKSDGTAAGTVLVKDIWPGGGPSAPSNLTNVNGTLYFYAWEGVNGYELWKSDGTAAGTVLVKDIYHGTNSAFPGGFTDVNGLMYFVAIDTNGTELWQSDGTEMGTVLVADIYPGSNNSDPYNLINVNGLLYFVANDGTNGGELWKVVGSPTFSLGTDSVGVGDTVIVPVSVYNFTNTASYQGTISFDTAALDLISLTNPASGLSNTFGLPGQGGIPLNKATFSWVDSSGNGATFPNGTMAITISFKVKNSANSGTYPVTIDSSFTTLVYSDGMVSLTPFVNQGAVFVWPCTPTEDPSFTYPDSVCAADAFPFATITGDTGGVFSVNQGASIDPITGSLDLSSTTAGTIYTITYSFSGSCPTADSQMIAVIAQNDASFDYPLSACPGSINPVATLTGTSGGIFSIAPSAGINPLTGELDMNSVVQGTIYTITYTVGDLCPDSSFHTFVAEDLFAPDTLALPDITGECSATVPVPTTTDNCAGTVTGVTSDSLTYDTQGIYVISWTFDDGNGNQTILSQTVIVEDTTPPVVICKNTTVQLNPDGYATVTPALLDSGSYDACGLLSLEISRDTFTVADLGENLVTIIATDINGNTDSCVAVVTVEGTNSIGAPVPSGLSLGVYPNPFSEGANIRWTSPWQGEISVEILNTMGQTIRAEKWQKNTDMMTGYLQMSDLASGVYMIRVRQRGYSQYSRVVKK
ncbi:MAG: T9SS type A sorting domain-containing protein [Bacteroidia bacterium]